MVSDTILVEADTASEALEAARKRGYVHVGTVRAAREQEDGQ